ncbi:Tn3 family transposase [Streptomyces kanamyceticus]|uniref:Tn3 family transposase n=1 Tax=Streptomyces kanamyceticus TaxID=1967 RepID=UPI0037DC3521
MLSSKTIDWGLIRRQYDQIVKYTTALRLGTAEAEQVLRRFTRGGAKRASDLGSWCSGMILWLVLLAVVG